MKLRSYVSGSLGALALMTLLPLDAYADTLIAPAKSTDVYPRDTAKLEQLFIDAYSAARRDRLLVTRVDENSQPPTDQVAEAKRVKASEYVVLNFSVSGGRIVARASKHNATGDVLFAEKVTVPAMDQASGPMRDLAEALARETPVAAAAPAPVAPPAAPPPPPPAQTSYASPPPPAPIEEEGGIKERENVMGVKLGIFGAWADNVAFDPMMAVGFHGKIEQPGYFVEVGAGAVIPTSSYYDGSNAPNRMGGVYAEMGAAAYLGKGELGPYVGGGIMPRIWSSSNAGPYANVAAYGQFGLMFFRSRTMRIFFDGRMAVNVTEVPIRTYNPTTFEWTTFGKHPLEFGGEFGIGW